MTTPDGEVVVHCNSITDVVRIPEETEIIGRITFAAIDDQSLELYFPID